MAAYLGEPVSEGAKRDWKTINDKLSGHFGTGIKGIEDDVKITAALSYIWTGTHFYKRLVQLRHQGYFRTFEDDQNCTCTMSNYR